MTVVVPTPGITRSRHIGLSRTEVRLAHTDPIDTEVEITAAFPLVECSAFLAPAQARALAADLVARADLIDPRPLTGDEIARAFELCTRVAGAEYATPAGTDLAELRALLNRTPTTAAPTAETGA